MHANPNHVEESATSVRSSLLMPAWMEVKLDAIARRTLSSRSQVIRRLLAKALEDEESIESVETAS